VEKTMPFIILEIFNGQLLKVKTIQEIVLKPLLTKDILILELLIQWRIYLSTWLVLLSSVCLAICTLSMT